VVAVRAAAAAAPEAFQLAQPVAGSALFAAAVAAAEAAAEAAAASAPVLSRRCGIGPVRSARVLPKRSRGTGPVRAATTLVLGSEAGGGGGWGIGLAAGRLAPGSMPPACIRLALSLSFSFLSCE